MADEIQKIQHFSESLYLRFLVLKSIQNLLEIALSLTVFEINDIFISAKIQDGGQNLGNSTSFRGTTSEVSNTQRVKNLIKIAPFETFAETFLSKTFANYAL